MSIKHKIGAAFDNGTATGAPVPIIQTGSLCRDKALKKANISNLTIKKLKA